MIKFPVAIVLYNPSLSAINRIINFVDLGVNLYIFDNSEKKNDLFLNQKGIMYYSYEYNYGLSFSLNFICNRIKEDKFDSFLFFDQDTIFTIQTLEFVQNFVNYKNLINDSILNSALAVNFRDNSVLNSPLNIINTRFFSSYSINEVFFNINSGTMYFLKNYYLFNWFDNKYFVDGVDYSFSLDVIINKFRNFSITNVPGLNHSEEQGDSSIFILGKKITSRVYSFKRNYDFLRSHFFLLIKTFKVPSIKPKLFILKAFLGYLFAQIIFRVNYCINKLF